MTSIYSYPTIFAIGHKAVSDIFETPVIVEEKLDGSQFSWSVINGELKARSKGQQIVLDAPDKLFTKAVEVIKDLNSRGLLKEGYIYRAEYISKPKHNALKYSRVPNNYLIIFDISKYGLESYIPYNEKVTIASEMGLECVPLLFEGQIDNISILESLLTKESCLGGTTIEGFVIKNYSKFTESEKKVMMAKYVSEVFKEVNKSNWALENPNQTNVLQQLINEYKTEPRWNKAIQHLKEAGKLEDSPRDIGILIKEIQADVLKEEKSEIKDRLFKYFWPKIERAIIAGFPEFYKRKLMESAFDDKT